MPVEVLYSEDADHALTELETNADSLYARTAAALGEFESNPTDPRWRRRKYTSPPVFGFTVRLASEDFLVLWSRTDDTVIVEYVGPDI